MVLDENASPGGRVWQALEARGSGDADDAAALALIHRFRASPVQTRRNATVWRSNRMDDRVEDGGTIARRAHMVRGSVTIGVTLCHQVLDAGGRIAGVIDLSNGFAPLRTLRHLPMTALPEIRRGLAWRRRLCQAGVRWIAASDVRAEDDTIVRTVSFHRHGG